MVAFEPLSVIACVYAQGGIGIIRSLVLQYPPFFVSFFLPLPPLLGFPWAPGRRSRSPGAPRTVDHGMDFAKAALD